MNNKFIELLEKARREVYLLRVYLLSANKIACDENPNAVMITAELIAKQAALELKLHDFFITQLSK